MADRIVNERGMTELHLAAYRGDFEWVVYCLEAGMDIDARDRSGYTPLHWAAFMGRVDGDREEVAAVLIRAGADLDARDVGGETALDVARMAGNEDIVQQLLEAGARPGAARD